MADPRAPTLERTFPPAPTLELTLDQAAPVRWESLGELFDRRPNTAGAQLTQVLRERVELRVSNRLSNGPLEQPCVADVGAVQRLATQLLEALPALPHRWFWFATPGQHVQPDEVRVTDIDLPVEYLWAGMDTCHWGGVEDGEHRERDLRGVHAFETAQGLIEIRSEDAVARFGPDLHRLLALLGNHAPTTPVTLRLTRPRGHKGRPRSFVRARLPRRPTGLGRAVPATIGEDLIRLGFTPQESGADSVWRRERGGRVEAVVFQAARVQGAFRFRLRREAVGGEAQLPSSRDAEAHSCYANADELRAQLQAALTLLQGPGEAWFADPDANDFEGWRDQGLVDSAAQRRPVTPKLP